NINCDDFTSLFVRFPFIQKFSGKVKIIMNYILNLKEWIFIRYLMLLFAGFLFLAGCGTSDTEEPAEDNTAPSEGTEEDAEDNSVEDKEGTGSGEEAETDTEGTNSGEDTSDDESDEESENTTGEDRSRTDDKRKGEAEKEEEDSDSESGTEDDDSSESSSSIDNVDADSTESESRDINFEVSEESLTGLDGTEMTSMFELNSGIGEQLANASESDAAIEEVLMPK